jgi:hypothetical protein
MLPSGAVLLAPARRPYECPNCDKTHVVEGPPPLMPVLHRCKGLRDGLTAPLVPAGTRAKVEAREREDMIGDELVQLHQGRPVMNVQVTRDEGEDCLVFAPTARVVVDG